MYLFHSITGKGVFIYNGSTVDLKEDSGQYIVHINKRKYKVNNDVYNELKTRYK